MAVSVIAGINQGDLMAFFQSCFHGGDRFRRIPFRLNLRADATGGLGRLFAFPPFHIES